MKFTVFTTGGTIASVPSEDGLQPGMKGRELIALCPELDDFDHEIRVVDLMSRDSSNMQPDDWLTMAEQIRAHASLCEAAVLLHGTDTMAWTAAALSYLLADVDIPVVLTGSMLTADVLNNDVTDNIFSAVQFSMQLAMYRRGGVAIAFDDVLIHGPRAAKADSRRKHAFVSVEYPLLGEMKHRAQYKIPWLNARTPRLSSERPWGATPVLERGVVVLPVFPGMRAHVLNALVDTGPRAIVLEGYGLGGIPFMGENLLPSIERGVQDGVHFVVRTQAMFGGTDLSVYEVGRKAMDLGAISAHDMTREALVTKLMLTLSMAHSRDELEGLLNKNLCDDVDAE